MIELAIERQQRNGSDAVEADLDRESRRQTTDFSALKQNSQASDQTVLVSPQTKLRPRSSFLPLQEWEGHVIDISERGFTARLVDMTREERVASEEADFDFDDVADPDRSLLREGAVFRWTIGYETAPGGSKKRVSQLVFRRLPKWTKKEIAQADRNAGDLLSGIIWE
ncbi:MAG: hypothetical protein C1943_14715 [Halochromatium sp.]|nr:hypothetical protein [Halochromatium sp.]